MKKIFLFILSLSFLIPGFIFAQSVIDKFPQDVQDAIKSTPGATEELEKAYETKINIVDVGIEEQISFTINPSVPRPNQMVTAEIAAYSSDLNRLQVSWYLNDVLVKKEIGAIKYNFQMGDLGKTTKIKVLILKADGTELEKNYSFTPAEVDLISEAQTFTPPFYEGAAYYTKQSDIKVTAIPQVVDENGKYISPNNLSYKWYENGSVVQDQSGYGKQNFIYKGKLLSNNVKIGVEISTISDGAVANTSIIFVPAKPEALVYEKNPVLGTLYNKIIPDSFSITQQEIEFEVVPFYFNSVEVFGGSTVYDWKLNGSKIASPNQNTLVFRNDKNEKGRSSIGVSISNSTLFQKASGFFSLIFGEKTQNETSF